MPFKATYFQQDELLHSIYSATENYNNWILPEEKSESAHDLESLLTITKYDCC